MSGAIYVPNYPSNNRVPGVFATVDATGANTATVNQRTLILAQKLPAGSALPGYGVVSAGVGEAQSSYGAGSMAAIAVERYRGLDPTGELWVLPMSDGGSSANATGTITFTGSPTANGTMPLYIDGSYVPVGMNAGDSLTMMSTETVAAINNWRSKAGNPLAWTATMLAGVVTLTARNGGPIGNQGTIVLSPLGVSGGQGTPGTTNVPGVTAALVQPSGGTVGPVIANALANLPVTSFDFIICPYNDTTSLNALQAYLGDSAGQWNWSTQLFGGGFTAYGGTLSQRTTWSTQRNDQHASAIGAYSSPSPDWHWAVDYAAACAVSLRADPTIPIGGLSQGVALNVMAPPLANQDSFASRGVLLNSGMSTFKVDHAGVVHVDRAITTYQSNVNGAPSNAYLNLNVPYQLTAYIRDLETLLSSNFNQVKLVADGSRTPPGSRMVTSQTILFSVIAHYAQICATGTAGCPAGLVQNAKAFAQSAAAVNAGGGVVKMNLPIQLGNQLIAIAMDVQFSTP